jgi:hypothetical protein
MIDIFVSTRPSLTKIEKHTSDLIDPVHREQQQGSREACKSLESVQQNKIS